MTERVNTFVDVDPDALTKPVEMMLIALGLYSTTRVRFWRMGR